DAHLEHVMPTPRVEQVDRGLAARMEDPVKDEIVGWSVELVGSLDLPRFQRSIHDESPPELLDGIALARGLPSKASPACSPRRDTDACGDETPTGLASFSTR